MFYLLNTFFAYFSITMLILFGITGFIIGYKAANFFIPPRDYWSKSGAAIAGAKLSVAIGAAYFAVVAGAYLLSKLAS